MILSDDLDVSFLEYTDNIKIDNPYISYNCYIIITETNYSLENVYVQITKKLFYNKK